MASLENRNGTFRLIVYHAWRKLARSLITKDKLEAESLQLRPTEGLLSMLAP